MACKILQIGVFFDGTGNTKALDKESGSMSNVAKLSELYRDGEVIQVDESREIHVKMFYANGVGTYNTEIETICNFIERKYDKGGGGGGAKRIYKMIDDVCSYLDANPYDREKESGFIKRQIDVFGFSRGAAMARDFVNTFYKLITKKNKAYKDVTFNFIGIFDTVGSFGKPGNDINYKPKREYLKYVDEDYLPNGVSLDGDKDFGIDDPRNDRKIELVLGIAEGEEELHRQLEDYERDGWQLSFREIPQRNNHTFGKKLYKITGSRIETELFEPYNFNLSSYSAQHIVHLVAHDEVRKNFPLTNTKGCSAKECSFIGVHSDIGGGYAPQELEEFIYDKEIIATSKELAHKQAQELVKKLNAKITEELDKYRWKVKDIDVIGVIDIFEDDSLKPYKVTLEKEVNNELSLIALHIMHQEAVNAGVPFKEIKEEIPQYLQKYYDFAKEHTQKAYIYAHSEDGQKVEDALSHHSARDPAQKFDHKTPYVSLYDGAFHDEPESGNDARYEDKKGKTVDGRKYPQQVVRVDREVYDNNPKIAVSPNAR